MRLLVTLLFFGALAFFVWTGLQYLMSRFARPLDQHRRDHDRIDHRLSDIERRLEPPRQPVHEEPRRR